MTDIELRPASPSDAQELLAIQKEAFHPMYLRYKDENSPYNNTIERMVQYITRNAGRFYKILNNGKAVGAVWYAVREDGVHWLGRIFVHPDWQGRGVGERALRLLEGICSSATAWELDTPIDAKVNRYFYEKLGYTACEDETERINDKLVLITYRKRLAMSYIETVKEYYNTHCEGEYARIGSRAEFLLTIRYMERYIQKGQSVLDIGGGPGRYSLYLATKGCDVTLFDLSPENVKFALSKSEEYRLPLRGICGDARHADALAKGTFDHVLLMGPLYHLLSEEDRAMAIRAAMRLLKPGGLLFASFISIYGGLIYYGKVDPSALLWSGEQSFQECLLDGCSYAGAAFTQAYLITPGEVEPLMEDFGLEKLHLFGQEGVIAPCERNIMSQPPEVIAAWLDLAEKLCERKELLSWSEHLMYIGRKSDL